MAKSAGNRVLAGRDYLGFVAALKERILTARISAARRFVCPFSSATTPAGSSGR